MTTLKWTIYCHIHRESGRRYIGLTRKTWRQRWNQHVYTSTRLVKKGWSHFANAIRKYGPEAFDHEVLEVCPTLEEANAAEERWIEHFRTRDPEKGFNLKKGGDHRPHPVRNPWNRPGYREKHAAALRSGIDRPEARERRSAASRKKWEDPAFRAAVTAGVTEAWRDPSYRERMSEISTEVNSRPEVKAAISASASSRPGKSSRFRGVCWNKSLGKWRAFLRHGGKMVNLGHFADEGDAAQAYDREALRLLQDSAVLNFPESTP